MISTFDFAVLVQDMRHKQGEYFKKRTSDKLIEAKAVESQVDACAAAIIAGGRPVDDNGDPLSGKLETCNWYAVISRGAMAFRFGPYSPATVGKLMEQCHKEGIPAGFVADMGPEFDWEIARDVRGVLKVKEDAEPGK